MARKCCSSGLGICKRINKTKVIKRMAGNFMEPRYFSPKMVGNVTELGCSVTTTAPERKKAGKSWSLGSCKQKGGKCYTLVPPGCRVAPNLPRILGERLAVDVNCSSLDPGHLWEGSLSHESSLALLWHRRRICAAHGRLQASEKRKRKNITVECLFVDDNKEKCSC